VKLAGALLIVLLTAGLPRSIHRLYFIPAGLLVCLWIVSRMPVGYALKRLLLAEFFVLGIAGLSLLAPGSVQLFASAILKSNLCVLTMIIFGWTTPFHATVETLRRVRMPSIMVTTIALLHRYLPVLRDESRRMQRARASRTFGSGKGLQWQTLASVAGQLFIRSADRAERIYMAMCSRGWK
jgi:cobalt/nickel transport system permease protein